MIVMLAGFTTARSRLKGCLKSNGWGRMWASYGPQWEYHNEPWGFDNGAWSAYTKGNPFPRDTFIRRLNRARTTCEWNPTVAIVPDIVAGGIESLTFSLQWVNELPDDWPWYLAVQDGMAAEDVQPHISRFAGLFLGGSNEFKRTCQSWCTLARDYGKLFHYGRCNRESWLYDALRVGVDSLDSATPIYQAVMGDMAKFRRFQTIVTGRCTQQTFA